MHKIQDGLHIGRLVVRSSAAVLVAGSIGFAAPALAAQSGNGNSAHAAQGQGTQPAGQTTHTGQAKHTSTSGHSGSQGGSSVSLPKPNHYQAQSDPDGQLNGGVDQPGGTGGVDTTTQDGNNGSGNDADCEDDNRGRGVPGHCKAHHHPTPAPAPAPGPAPGGETIPPVTGGTTGGTTPPVTGDVPGGTTVGGVTGTGTSLSPVTALPGVQVAAPQGSSSQVTTQQASTPQASASGASAGQVESAATVLPNTGAGQALLGLGIAALAALALGGGLVRQGRRATR